MFEVKMKSQFLFLVLTIMGISFSDVQSQWIQSNGTQGKITAFASIDSNLFASTDAYGIGIYLSTDSGKVWKPINAYGVSNYCTALIAKGKELFAGYSDNGIVMTTDNGSNWQRRDSAIMESGVSCLTLLGNNIFAGTLGRGVYKSTNDGKSWTTVNNGLLPDTIIYCFTVSGNNIFVGTNVFSKNASGISVSTDTALNWKVVNDSISRSNILSLAVKDSDLFAGTLGEGIYLSTDYGKNWIASNSGISNNAVVTSLAIDGKNLFAGTYEGVFLSTDNGKNWSAINDGLTAIGITALAIYNGYLFAGTNNNGVWWRSLSGIVTNVEKDHNELSLQFTISQNYPNPFNPATTIKYQITNSSIVTLKIYDMLGREIETLVDGYKTAGEYKVLFNASNLASGIYFYRIHAGDFVETKKLILLK